MQCLLICKKGTCTFAIMNTAFDEYNAIVASIPKEIHEEVAMEMALSARIYDLMRMRGLTKTEFARALGKRPCEITKWLSGQHNFTIRTLSMLSAFFGEPLISCYKNKSLSQ